METKTSAIVPQNSLQEIISQIKERENSISQKILEFEAFREKISIFLIFVAFLLFFLIILNLLLFFRLRQNFLFFQNLPKKEKRKIKEKPKEEKLKFELSSFSQCQIKNCLFFRQNKSCQLKEFAQRLVNFSHSLSQGSKNNIFLSKLGKEIGQNCKFDRNSLFGLKRKLKKIRNLLNKIKREKGVSKKIKKEIESLWKTSHCLTLKIKKVLKTK